MSMHSGAHAGVKEEGLYGDSGYGGRYLGGQGRKPTTLHDIEAHALRLPVDGACCLGH